MLEDRPEQRVVHHDHRFGIQLRHSIGSVPNVGHHDGWIGGCFYQHDGEVLGRTNGRIHLPGVAGFHRNAQDAERAEEILDQVLGAAVDRDRIEDALAGPREREQRGHDSGHAGVEHQSRMRAGFERNQTILENLRVGVVEARVDQIRLFVRFGLSASGHQIEGALGGLGAGEYVGRTAKYSRARGSNRKAGIETAGENLRRWAEGVLPVSHEVTSDFSVALRTFERTATAARKANCPFCFVLLNCRPADPPARSCSFRSWYWGPGVCLP